jgi:hypothetical protein
VEQRIEETGGLHAGHLMIKLPLRLVTSASMKNPRQATSLGTSEPSQIDRIAETTARSGGSIANVISHLSSSVRDYLIGAGQAINPLPDVPYETFVASDRAALLDDAATVCSDFHQAIFRQISEAHAAGESVKNADAEETASSTTANRRLQRGQRAGAGR